MRGCQHIVHGGDIGSLRILEDLAALAPLTAVRGNNDRDEWARHLPEAAVVQCGAVRLYVIHDLSELAIDAAAEGVRVVVSGHSHQPRVEERHGVLYVNPGSAGPRRFRLPVAVGELVVEGRASRGAHPGAPMGLTMTPVRRFIDRIPAVRIVVRAVVNYVLHQSANQAGSVAFSTLLSMFPLLLFVSATAAFIGEPGTAAELAGRIMEYLPAVVAHALQPAVEEVLSQRNRALVAVGMVVTLWTASSGTLAIRTALNKAYGVERGMSFWRARIKVTLFTVVGTLCSVFVFSSVVILPYAWKLLEQATDADPNAVWLRDGVRYGLAFVVLVVLYAFFYGWLPDIRQRLRTVLPGAIVGAAMWLGAAMLLSHVLRSAWKLALVYGGFAGLVATLVFLYVSAATLIFGAEINAVMLDGKQKGSAQEGADDAF